VALDLKDSFLFYGVIKEHCITDFKFLFRMILAGTRRKIAEQKILAILIFLRVMKTL